MEKVEHPKMGDLIACTMLIDYGNFIVRPGDKGIIDYSWHSKNRLYWFVKWDGYNYHRDFPNHVISDSEAIVSYFSFIPEELFEI